ncbi:MAG: hypothetical protein AAB914_02095 [Patescibacteria group bacterium]
MLKNKKLIIAIIAIVVIVLAGVIFLVVGKDSSTNTSSQDPVSSKKAEPNNQTTKGSLSSLAVGKKAQECTMNYSGPSGSGTGAMHSDGNGKARMHIDLKTEKGNVGQTDQIMKEGKAYSWTTSDEQTFGMMMDMSKMDSQQGQNTATSSGPQPNQDFDISCKSWKVDESKFAVPTNVNFMDMNNPQNSLPTAQ